jgi:hypothetical protein
MNDNTRITLAVDYPVINLNLCTLFWITWRNGGLKTHLIAIVNHKPSKKNDVRYTAMNKSPTLRGWYKYDNNIINLVKFLKRNTNSMLMDFQKTASIFFYVDMKYVSVCHNNLCNSNEVIDITGHDTPPVIDQLQDATLSLLLSNTLSLLSSYVSSSLSSNNSSRFLTSVRLKTNSDNNSIIPSSSQSTKNGKSNSSDIRIAKCFLSFCDWAMGSMSEGIYNTPHQEWCVARTMGRNMSKMLPCTHKGCTVRVHRFCQIDWLHRYDLEVNHNDLIFCRQHNKCYQNCVQSHPLHFPPAAVQPHPILIQDHKESRCMLGSFGMTKSHLRVLMMFWRATAIIILMCVCVLVLR